jgi:hypothetical protein
MTKPQQDGDEWGSQQRQDVAASGVVAGIAAAWEVQRAAVAGVVARDPADALDLLELARVVDGMVRSSHGLLVQVLARMDEVRAVRGGVATWLTAELGYSPGRARGVASDARRLRPLSEVTEQLSAGVLPVGAERVLARAAKAAVNTERDTADTVADTLNTLRQDGMQAAEQQVRYLAAHGQFPAAQYLRFGDVAVGWAAGCRAWHGGASGVGYVGVRLGARTPVRSHKPAAR